MLKKQKWRIMKEIHHNNTEAMDVLLCRDAAHRYECRRHRLLTILLTLFFAVSVLGTAGAEAEASTYIRGENGIYTMTEGATLGETSEFAEYFNNGGTIVSAVGGTIYNRGTIECARWAAIYNYEGGKATEVPSERGYIVVYSFPGSQFTFSANAECKVIVYDMSGTVIGSEAGDQRVICHKVNIDVSDVKTVHGDFIQGADGQIYLPEGGTGTISLHNPSTKLYRNGVELTKNEEGDYILSDVTEAVSVGDKPPVMPDPGKADSDKDKTAKSPAARFGQLKLQYSKSANASITLTWSRMFGAKTYVLYGNRNGARNKKIASLAGRSRKVAKIGSSKLKKGTYYRFTVVAYSKSGKKTAVSKPVYIATAGGKAGNDKAVRIINVSGSKKTLKTGRSFRLKASTIKESPKMTVKKYRDVQFESSNMKVATVSSKGMIKARAKGKCTIYAYAQSGRYAKVTLTVK